MAGIRCDPLGCSGGPDRKGEVIVDILFLLVPLSMAVLALLVWAAFWAIRNNQYEDMEGPAHRILLDDDDPRIPDNAKQAEQKKEAEKPTQKSSA